MNLETPAEFAWTQDKLLKPEANAFAESIIWPSIDYLYKISKGRHSMRGITYLESNDYLLQVSLRPTYTYGKQGAQHGFQYPKKSAILALDESINSENGIPIFLDDGSE